MAFLSQRHELSIGRNLGFQVLVIKPGTFHDWKAADGVNRLRLCSVATGKVRVKIHDRDFMIGPNGMFKIGPSVDCVATNPLYIDATLHITVLPGNFFVR